MQPTLALGRFLAWPENRSALAAAQDLLACWNGGKVPRTFCPLYFHGPPGAGKSFLVSNLIQQACRQHPSLVVQQLAARDWPALSHETPESFDRLNELRQADWLVVEDLQFLARINSGPLVEILDARALRQLPTIVTALHGPGKLNRDRFPARLTSRLASGLVVVLETWNFATRRSFLEETAQRWQLALAPEILHWLAHNLTGGARQLEGALHQLRELSRQQCRRLDLPEIQQLFHLQPQADRTTVNHIAERVSGHFQLDADLLLSRRRLRTILLPRQVSMYLARKLTSLSLEQIGAFFGGRDHSTVLHACRKIELELARDAVLCGAVRQLQAELG